MRFTPTHPISIITVVAGIEIPANDLGERH